MSTHVRRFTNTHSSSHSLMNKDTKTKHPTTLRRYKSLLSCVVCNGDAHGYNFDAISCESCKAFFRRNALRPSGKLKCRGNGKCSVTVDQRKRCKKCRLEKCFMSGMRKEWILSEAEKKEKKIRIEENRRFKQIQDNSQEQWDQINIKTNDDTSEDSLYQSSLMTESDLLNIQHIETSYTEAVKLNAVVGVPLYPATYSIISMLELLQVPLYLASMRLITYLKHITEFNQLDKNDQLILVKNNMLPTIFIHTALIYDLKTDTFHEHDTEDPIFEVIHLLWMIDDEFDRRRQQYVRELTQIIGDDRIFFKLLMLIIIFAKDSCVPESSTETNFNDSSIILSTQNFYIDLLYKHSLDRYGTLKTIKLFTRLTGQLIHLQDFCAEMKRIAREHIDWTQLTPMMQSLL